MRARHTLELIRHMQGLTQDELARKAKVAPRTITNIENGHWVPRFFIRRKILKALNIGWSDQMRIFDPEREGFKKRSKP